MEKVRATNTNTSIPYWLAGNQYADLDFLSFKALILMRTPTPQPTGRKLQSGVRDAGLHTRRQLQQALPAEVNWLAQGKVSAVKNQGGCGSCWAFAAVAALESAYLIARPGTTAAGPPPLHLSEQQIVSCVNAAAGYSSQACLS
ncbi:kinesin BC2, partial [Haematococcus lacustris]